MTNINQKQLCEYLNIFGKSKMQGLLKDYLAESNKSWEHLDKISDHEKRHVFHCGVPVVWFSVWKSFRVYAPKLKMI